MTRFMRLAAWTCGAAAAILAPVAGAAEATPPAGAAKMSPESSLRVARAMRASGDAASAVSIYQGLAAGQPADAPVKIELGDAMLDAGLIDDAIGVYSAAAGDARAQLGLARAQLALGHPDKALPFAEKAAALDARSVPALNLRGVVLDRLGRHPEAQACYRSLLKLSPQSIAGRTNLALSLALTGQYAEALDILQPIARSANATPQDRQNLAFVYGLKGDIAAARALGRVDLDEKTAVANAEFLAFAREHLAAR